MSCWRSLCSNRVYFFRSIRRVITIDFWYWLVVCVCVWIDTNQTGFLFQFFWHDNSEHFLLIFRFMSCQQFVCMFLSMNFVFEILFFLLSFAKTIPIIYTHTYRICKKEEKYFLFFVFLISFQIWSVFLKILVFLMNLICKMKKCKFVLPNHCDTACAECQTFDTTFFITCSFSVFSLRFIVHFYFVAIAQRTHIRTVASFYVPRFL